MPAVAAAAAEAEDAAAAAVAPAAEAVCPGCVGGGSRGVGVIERARGPLAKEDIGKKCLVLDLDETLVHSSFKPVLNCDFVVPVEIDGTVHRFYVLKRPGVDEFMRRVGSQFEVVVFTTSLAKFMCYCPAGPTAIRPKFLSLTCSRLLQSVDTSRADLEETTLAFAVHGGNLETVGWLFEYCNTPCENKVASKLLRDACELRRNEIVQFFLERAGHGGTFNAEAPAVDGHVSVIASLLGVRPMPHGCADGEMVKNFGVADSP
ncbi:hypothetical protein DFJ73DRAFT_965456 [Zopfochytrium polystomum]|nr:hypothetical protein DFJ73DRAFT_965456 [Zopfochytrium polystomum]